MTEADERHLGRAVGLAAAAPGAGDMPYGSPLVGPAGDVLAEDRNTAVTEQGHHGPPELKLARWAARRLDADVARQTTMYTSCQPCPMCTDAIAHRLGRVVFALSGEQLQELRPAAAVSPDAADLAYEGRALFAAIGSMALPGTDVGRSDEVSSDPRARPRGALDRRGGREAQRTRGACEARARDGRARRAARHGSQIRGGHASNTYAATRALLDSASRAATAALRLAYRTQTSASG